MSKPSQKQKKPTRKPAAAVKLRKPSLKQKSFVDHYVESGNATRAYYDAGYKATTRAVADANARKLLHKPTVKAYLDQQIAAKDSMRIAKQDEILQFLTSVMRGEETEKIPLGLGMGEQKLVDKDTNVKDRVKAAELLGKRYLMFSEKQLQDLAAEEQRLRLEMLKAQLEILKAQQDKNGGDVEDDGFMAALQKAAKDVWADGSTEA